MTSKPTTKYFLILPGLSSPYHEKYTKVYDLLREYAIINGYIPFIIKYPGQINQERITKGKLSPSSALKQVLTTVKKLSKNNCEILLCGISFGCEIALKAGIELNQNKKIKGLILWGTIPYWLTWKNFFYSKPDGLGNGSTFINTKSFFRQITPIEYMISGIEIPVKIGLGTTDKYISQSFILYLKEICNNVKISIELIPNCGHNVFKDENQDWEKYITFIFNFNLNVAHK